MTLAVQRRDEAGRTAVARVDRVRWRLDASSKVVHANGMVDAWGVATRVGVFEYTDGPDAIREFVSDAELFAADSLATLKGVPFTVQHPDGDVTADNATELTRGWVLEVRPKRDEGTVETLVRIASREALEAIEAGTVELSCGYETIVEHTSGVSPHGEAYDAVQTKRRYNHLALVDIARVGHVARLRLDGVQRTDTMKKIKLTRKADGRTFDVPEAIAKLLEGAKLDPKARRDEGLEVEEVTLRGTTLVLPTAMVEAIVAMIGAEGGSSADPAAGEGEGEGEVPIAAGANKVAAGKGKGDGTTTVKVAVDASEVGKIVADALAKADGERRLDGEVRSKAAKLLPRSYPFAGTTWRIAADAIAHVDEDRKDAADALVAHADKGDARAQGRLLGMLETLEQLADADDDERPVHSFARAVGEAHGDGSAISHTDSLTDARTEQRARKLNRKPAAAAAAASK